MVLMVHCFINLQQFSICVKKKKKKKQQKTQTNGLCYVLRT